jgi:NAD(P)-dependent dehydrogenase (short-subunit alcohol dehydrogenase family)
MHLNAAATYASKGVRINCVAPGLFASPASAPTSDPAQVDKFKDMYPMKRIAKAREVAEVGGGRGGVVRRRAARGCMGCRARAGAAGWCVGITY